MEKITLYEIEAGKYVKALAEKIKQMPEFSMPEWAPFVKTSPARERTPVNSSWWFERVASILRQIYLRGVIGVGRLRTRYGGKKDRGMKPSHFFKGSGKIVRIIMQDAEKAGLVEKSKGKKVGRKMTAKGKSFMDEVAVSLK